MHPRHSPSLSNSKQVDAESTSDCAHTERKPFLSDTDVQKLLQNLYSVETRDVKRIEELIGYDDQNFYISLEGGEPGEGSELKEFILKAINSEDSEDRGAFELHVSVLKFLRGKGFCCAKPVVNVKGDYLSLEKMYKVDGGTDCGDDQRQYGLFLIFLLTYVPGQMISKIKLIPEQLCFDAGVKLAQMDEILWDFSDIPDSFKIKAANNIWSTECFPRIRNHIDEVEDGKRRQLVESVIKTFEGEVAPKISTLRKCLIHSDYNDDNILVTEKSLENNAHILDPSLAKRTKCFPQYDITGVIDFTDMIYSCLVFEIANAMALMLHWKLDDPTAATSYLLAGFQSIIPLTAEELDLLYVCMVVHVVHDLVLSLYSHRLHPDNEHVMITQGGWKFLEELWGDPGTKGRVEKLWKDIGDSYRN